MRKSIAIFKLFVLIIVSLLFATAPVSAQNTTTVKIFLLGGQSNMVGEGKTVNLKSPYNKPFSSIKIWNPKTKIWAPLSPEVVNRQGYFGPEIYFGHAIAKAFPADDIRLVKYAVGGTALYNDWSPVTKGRQYVNFMRTAKTALADLDATGIDYKISGMLWLQGESDAHEKKAETYKQNLSNFIAHMRTEFKTSKMSFIIARVRNYYGGKSGQAKIVRDAQVNVAESTDNVAWFDTDDCAILIPGHYNASGLVKIGNRFAEKYKEIISKSGVEQEGLISIIPLPEKIEKTGGTFALTSKTLLVASVPHAKIVDQYLGTATGYHFRISKEGDDNCITLIQDDQLSKELGAEGYKLSVISKGITIQAAGEAGVFYGLQTLRQLLPAEIYQNKRVAQVSWLIPCVEIVDKPRFKWRGMMLDPARNYVSPSFIKKFIDLMAMHKLNRLHLHLTDSNAWRVEIKKYPELTAKGSGGKFYSQKELRDIVQYAADKHIVVIPEIESPGHSGAALSVHPEWRTGHAVNLQEKTIAAFHTIFKEVMDIFPSEYIHVGGDEVWASWLNNEADLQVIEKQGLAKNNLAIQEWLQGRLIEPILAARRRPAMWFMKESWKIGESPLNKDNLILGWFGREESMKAVEAGYDVVMAPMDGTYFDYRTQRDSPVSGIGINTLDNVYNYDPLPAKLANDKTTKRILGVQGQLWGADFKEPREVENHGFPRTCALAEVAWTARSQKNYKQFIKRMEKQYQRLEVLGVNYYKLKTPMTVVATESFTVKRGEKQSFEWPLSSYLNKGAGEYEMMFHVPVWYQGIEASHVQLICNGKVLVAPDWVGNTTKSGGKLNGLFRIKLPHYDPTASYVLKAEVKNLSRRGDCAFEFCLRKKTR